MAENGGSDNTLEVNPLVAQLIAQGAETAITLRGLVGPARSDGYVCIYPRLNNLSDSIEIARADILHSIAVPQSVLGAVILWVKKDAKISIRRVGIPEAASLSAENLAGLRKGPPGMPAPNLVELRKGRLRMRVAAQQTRAASPSDTPYCGAFCDEGCLVDPYPE